MSTPQPGEIIYGDDGSVTVGAPIATGRQEPEKEEELTDPK